MKKILILLTLLLLVKHIATAQTILYVDAGMPASGTGTSWSSAYKTLGEALTVANIAPGAIKYVINVAGGNYYPTGVQNSSARDSAFVVTRGGISLYGGFPSGGGLRNTILNATLLSGNIGNTALNTDNSYNILLAVNISAASDSIILDGLTFTGGRADSAITRSINNTPIDTRNGSAISCINVKNKTLVNNCSIAGNYSLEYGGGIYLSGSYLHITNSTFSGNTAIQLGGALHSQPGAYFYLTNSTFSNNTADLGGGLCSNGSTSLRNIPTSFITGCTFTNNSAAGVLGYGGGMYEGNTVNNPTRITNTTFLGNTAMGGGGIAVSYGLNSDSTSLRNCTFINNSATFYGGGLYCITNLYFGVYNSSFTGNSAGEGGGIYNGMSATSDPDRIVNIVNCTFTSDSAGNGGGVYNTGITNIEHSKFLENKAVNGGGIYSERSVRLYLTNDTISGNSVTRNGGGVYTKSIRSGLDHNYANCLFSGNKALGSGGALCDSATGPFIDNCTFAGDTASIANGILCQRPFPQFLNTIVWDGDGNSIVAPNTQNFYLYFTNSTVQGGYLSYRNDTLNPKFMAPQAASAAPTTTGDYRLQPCSPSINTGINEFYYPTPTDLQGNLRVSYETVDRGAFEYSGTYLPLITGTSTICKNSITTLANTALSGVWASADTNIAAVNAVTGVVTGRSGGVTEIRYQANGTLGCLQTSTRMVTVDAGPVIGAIAGDSLICVNKIVQLTSAITGGIWSSNTPNIAQINAATGELTPVSLGIANITYSATSGNGCTDSVHKYVRIVRSFSYNQRTTICPHTTYQFGSQTLYAIGSYIGVFTGATGCDSVVNLLLDVQPSMDKRITQNGIKLTSAMSMSSGTSFQWVDCSNNHAPIPGATSGTFIPTMDGSYAVIVNYNGCIDSSDCIDVFGVGIAPVTAGRGTVQIYPNPATDQITIQTTNLTASRIIFRDITGRLIHEERTSGTTTANFSLNGFAAGTYIIEVSDGTVLFRQLITVKR